MLHAEITENKPQSVLQPSAVLEVLNHSDQSSSQLTLLLLHIGVLKELLDRRVIRKHVAVEGLGENKQGVSGWRIENRAEVTKP